MIKNIIILFLLFCLGILVYDNNKNVDVIVDKMSHTKDIVVDGTNYVTKAFEKEFSVQDFNVDIDIPSMQIQKEPFSESSKTGGIREDTFFNEEKK